jgi:lipoprotein-releasing system ATP-binding protein
MSELRAERIVKRFDTGEGTLEVLSQVDLRIADGESIAILGVSGSGKSTLLHILGGLEHPSEGRVTWDGQDLYTLERSELAHFRNRNLGFVFQFHHLLPEFDALENLMLPCLIAGWTRARAADRAREMLTAVGLDARRTHRPGKLSGGERQRVAIARALVLSPPVILADEPTGNLDPHTAGAAEDLLLGLNEEAGTALVLVTHNEKLASRLAKKSYLIDGRLES